MPPTSHRAPDMGDLETLQRNLEKQIDAVEETMRAAYPSRAELLDLIEKLGTRITCLEISKATLEGKANQSSVTLVLILSLLGLALTIFGMIFGL